MGNRRGSILVVVLWLLSLLAAMSVALGGATRQRATLLSRVETRAQLAGASLSAVEKAKGILGQDIDLDFDSFTDVWAVNTELSRMTLADSCTIEYSAPWSSGVQGRSGLLDEESKMPLNSAEPAMLARLIQTVIPGFGSDRAEEIAYSIVDWRDGDSTFQSPDHGAEDDTYEDFSPPYAAKDAPFESYDELLLVRGMDRAIFDQIRPFVTPFGGGAVNVNTARKEVLGSLGLPQGAVDKILKYRAGADGRDGTVDDRSFSQPAVVITMLNREQPPLDAGEQAALENVILGEKLATNSTHFTVLGRATAPGGAWVEIEAVLDRKGRVVSYRTSPVQWPSR